MNNTVIYPGTFDPITFGHIDLIERAAAMFDRVVVGIAANVKKQPVFSLEERVNLASQALAHKTNVQVTGFDKLLTTFAQECGANIILRGLRAMSDFDYEFQLAGMYRRLAPRIESLFLMPAEKYTYLSSSFVREVAFMHGDVTQFVPDMVVSALHKKMQQSD